jgi:hypothetical protein
MEEKLRVVILTRICYKAAEYDAKYFAYYVGNCLEQFLNGLGI